MSVIVLSNAIPDGSLNGAITNVATSLTLQTGEGATFPTPPFKIGINSEAMLCTAKATDTLTVTRNYDGTTATAHSDTDVVKHIFTAEDFPFRLDDTTDDYMLQKNLNLNGNEIIGASASYAKAYRTSDWSIPTVSTHTAIPFQAESFDTDDYWEGVTNPTRFVAPVDGIYRVSMGGRMQQSSSATAVFGYMVNGVGVLTSQEFFGVIYGEYTHCSGSDLVQLDADDYVEFTGKSGGSTRLVRGATSASIELVEAL